MKYIDNADGDKLEESGDSVLFSVHYAHWQWGLISGFNSYHSTSLVRSPGSLLLLVSRLTDMYGGYVLYTFYTCSVHVLYAFGTRSACLVLYLVFTQGFQPELSILHHTYLSPAEHYKA